MSFKVTTLDNGLRVATDRMDHVGTVSVGVWVGAGTRAEPAEINGAAHFLEHMAFKGTKRRSARGIAEEIEAVGGHLNAYTARENTAFYAKVLKDDLPLATDILADILQNPTFDEAEFKRERSVILQEIGQCHDTPDDVIHDHFQEVAFPDQAMGRPVLGTVETVNNMPRDAIRGFMADRYAGETMILAAAGNVEHDALVDLAAERFDGIDRKPDLPQEPAVYRGGEFRENRDSEQVHLLLGFPGPAYGADDFYAANVMSVLFGGGMSSRLFQEIREERGLVYSIGSFNWSFSDSGLFGIYAGTGETETAELVPVLCEEIAKLADTLTEEEVDRARAQVKAGLCMSRESTGGRCDQLGQQILIHGRPLSEEEQLESLEAVDRTTIADCARAIFTGKPTLAAIGPLSRLESLNTMQDRLPSA